MFYAKNLPTWERLVRIVLGLAGLLYAALNLGTSTLAVGVGITAATLALTGLFGFCPMCAMVGRKLDQGH
ncbi:MAG: DUF2892 domain-containing protein [Burkholderiales bacterium]|nr:DUF2892 domain-containing protein [Burkholderiales bacterium]